MPKKQHTNTGQLKIDFGDDFYETPVERSPYASSAVERHAEEPVDPVTASLIHYVSLGSGSSGNCAYLGTHRGGILIDAGIKPDLVEPRLAERGISMDRVRAILLTHDHSDHVRYAYPLLRAYKHMHLYCTNRVLNGMLRKHSVSKRIKDYHIPIFKETPFRVLDFEVTAFEVPHDGSDNMGFSIDYAGRSFVVATDMGAVWPRARHYISRANYLVIESNYDEQMLRDGRYPEYLKARIRTERGHMQNEHTAQFLAEVWHPALKYIFLCHLSADNNTPEKALEAVRRSLTDAGIRVADPDDPVGDADVRLMALPRFEATRRYVFRQEGGTEGT